MNLCISFLSFLNNRYIFLFLSTNSSFTFIAWSHNFSIGILSLTFFPIFWILLQIPLPFSPHSKFPIPLSLSSLLLLFPFLVFFLFLFLLFPFFHFISSFSFFLSFFYFYHSSFPYFNLHCFSYSSRYLVIFTSPIL